MSERRNTTPVAGHGAVKATCADEMAALDRLGPRLRQAYYDALLPWSALASVRRAAQMGWNLNDPAVDARMAAELTEIDRRRAAETRAA